MYVLSNTSLVLEDTVIPLAICSASRSRSPKLEMATPDGGHVRQQLVDDITGDPVAHEDVQMGTFVGDVFHPVSAAKLEAIASECKLAAIQLIEFAPKGRVPLDRIDGAYWLQPRPGGAKLMALLARAMRDTGRVAVVKFTLRQGERIGVIRPSGSAPGALILATLTFANEWLNPDGEVKLARVTRSAVLEAAKALIERNAGAGDGFDTARNIGADKRRRLVERSLEPELARA